MESPYTPPTTHERSGVGGLDVAPQKGMKRAITYLGVSMTLSSASAILFVIMMTLTLPESDMAHGQVPFADPLVLPVMLLVAGVCGILGWPFFVLLGWRADPLVVTKITGASVLGTVIVGTPINPALGWPGACLAGILALIFCFLRYRKQEANKPCVATGDNVSGGIGA